MGYKFAGLFRGSKGTLILRCLGIGFSYASTVYLAKSLGASTFGLFVILFFYASIAAILVQVGRGSSVLRLIPRVNEKKEYLDIVKADIKVLSFVSLVAGVTLLFLTRMVGQIDYAGSVYFLAVSTGWMMYCAELLKASGCPERSVLVGGVMPQAVFLLLLILFPLSIDTSLLLCVVSRCMSIVLGVYLVVGYLLKGDVRLDGQAGVTNRVVISWLDYCLFVFIPLTVVCLEQAPVFLMDYLQLLEFAAIFSLACKIIVGYKAAMSAVGATYISKLIRLEACSDYSSFQKVLTVANGTLKKYSILLFCLSVVYGAAIGWLLGASYESIFLYTASLAVTLSFVMCLGIEQVLFSLLAQSGRIWGVVINIATFVFMVVAMYMLRESLSAFYGAFCMGLAIRGVALWWLGRVKIREAFRTV